LGVKLRSLVRKSPIDLRHLSGAKVAIDAYNALYQFLAIIRQADGTPLKDNTGKVTSHISGLFYRTSNMLQMGIKPIFVFDGVPPALKEMEIKHRAKVKEEATIAYEKAIAKGDMKRARLYAQATSRLKDYMEDDSKLLLNLMGIPWIQAPSEGEAQAAHMSQRGDADYCASQDYDTLLFGAPKLVRNVTVSGRRKLPGKNIYVEVVPELIVLKDVLRECEISYEQLVDVGILIGTDFNPDGIKGLGPKTALKLIKEYGSIEMALPHIKNAEFTNPPKKIREIFLHPKVRNDYTLNWKEVNSTGLVDFLVKEKNFSETRVNKALQKMQEGAQKLKGRTTLESWFG
jgi:flap endonuclease-1